MIYCYSIWCAVKFICYLIFIWFFNFLAHSERISVFCTWVQVIYSFNDWCTPIIYYFNSQIIVYPSTSTKIKNFILKMSFIYILQLSNRGGIWHWSYLTLIFHGLIWKIIPWDSSWILVPRKFHAATPHENW